jgi:hypothetical protein
MAECSECNGTGECQNDFHSSVSGIDPMSWANFIVGESCPACGVSAMDSPGKCSVCGGTGESDD